MPSWVNRTELSGSSTAANGTTAHICTFTAATSNNFLVAVVAGAVTFTTPSGWSLLNSGINNAAVYVFTKTASSGESSFNTTHNGSDYPILGVVYEFAAGTSSLSNNSAYNLIVNSPATGPAVSGLTGTYSRFTARSCNIASGGASGSTVWTLPTIEDYDAYVTKVTNDGVLLTIAYDDNVTGSTFTPSSTITQTGSATVGEGVAWGMQVVAPTTNMTALMWVT